MPSKLQKRVKEPAYCGTGLPFFIGRAVQKEFKGHGVFSGRVADFNAQTGYLIEYEDGDAEDLSESHLVRDLLPCHLRPARDSRHACVCVSAACAPRHWERPWRELRAIG